MMTGKEGPNTPPPDPRDRHPDEVELLSYVENDVLDAERSHVSAHVATCSECAETIRRLEAGRAALRASPLLELPRERREAIVTSVARREQARRRPAFSLGRGLAVLAPVAAVAAAVALAITLDGGVGGGGEEEAARPAAAEESAAETAAEQPAGAATQEALDAVRSVAGPPADVAELLQKKGLDARVVDGRVEVRNADPQRVRRVLADRPDGYVAVVVK